MDQNQYTYALITYIILLIFLFGVCRIYGRRKENRAFAQFASCVVVAILLATLLMFFFFEHKASVCKQIKITEPDHKETIVYGKDVNSPSEYTNVYSYTDKNGNLNEILVNSRLTFVEISTVDESYCE